MNSYARQTGGGKSPEELLTAANCVLFIHPRLLAADSLLAQLAVQLARRAGGVLGGVLKPEFLHTAPLSGSGKDEPVF